MPMKKAAAATRPATCMGEGVGREGGRRPLRCGEISANLAVTSAWSELGFVRVTVRARVRVEGEGEGEGEG